VGNNEIANEKHPISSGIPCLSYQCVKCCTDTHMPLSHSDIKRISAQGYKFKNIAVKRGREHHLKNVNGYCIFLKDKKCAIYDFRPEGCRLYPLIQFKNSSNVVIHDYCPHKSEFKFNDEDVKRLNALLKEL